MPSRPSLGVPTVAALAVAVLAVSVSGPLIAYAAAPALAVAFWRNAFGAASLSPLAARRPREVAWLLGSAGRLTLLGCVLSGVTLAVHFGTWVPSVRLTAVATATALVATQPVWQGLIALGQGRRLPGVIWVGIGLAVAGAALASGVDLALSGRAFTGDVLALIGAIAVAVYTAFGERIRIRVSTSTYAAVCYGVCALTLAVVCLVGGVRLHGYPAAAWVAIAALTVGPQLLGHTMFNYALHRVSATTVSVLILLEVPGAALIGWLWLHQAPRADQWPGLAVLMAGVVVVVLGSRTPPAAPAPVAGAP